MNAIDFRLRPPIKAIADNDVMYTNTERTRRLTRNAGLGEPTKVLDSLSVTDTIDEMDRADVEIGVVPGRRFSTQISGGGEIANEKLAQLTRDYPGRFRILAALDLRSPLTAIRETEELLGQDEYNGLMLEPGLMIPEMYVDDRSLYPIYEIAQAAMKPVALMFGALSGLTVDHPNPRSIDRIAADFPKLDFVATHGGWPYVTEIIAVAHRRRNVYLEPDMYLFGMAGWRDYVEAGNTYLSDRFLFASSFPYLPLDAAVKRYEELFNADVLEDIMYRNARRIFGLEERGHDGRWISDTADE